jgi:hypothetical protein
MNKNNNIMLDQCLKFLKSEEIKKEIKSIIKPFIEYIFKELSIYLFFFVFFILSSFLLHLGVLILLIRYNNKLNKQE